MKQLTDTTWQSDNGLITFIQGDCMDFMAGCKENEFELAVVDPPYGIGEDGGKARTRGSKKTNGKKKSWDKERPPAVYFDKLKSVSKNQIIWGGNYFSDLLPVSRCWLYWQKNMGGDFADGELAWTSFDEVLRQYTKRSETHKRIHSCQKPIDLYRWIFKNYAKPTDHILDTHGGSFSSAIAAHMEGLRMTIIELDPEYFHKAITRFATYEAQQTIKFD